jgi:hypothetical protein
MGYVKRWTRVHGIFIKFLSGGVLGLSFGKLDLRVRNTVLAGGSGLRQKGVMGGGWGLSDSVSAPL